MTWQTILVLGALELVLVFGCAAATTDVAGASAPGLTFPTHLPASRPAEGGSGSNTDARESGEPQEAVQDAGASPIVSDLPDPPALMMARQWQYELLYDHGEVSVAKVRPMLFDHPVATARQVGRYAVELWIGRELVDRVRFDFPGLAGESPPSGPRRPLEEPPTLASGAVVSRTILVPASPRATRAELVDRATGRRTPLPWPPDNPLDPIETVPDHQPDDSPPAPESTP